jgi:ABC-type transporter Mla subunit MlaD
MADHRDDRLDRIEANLDRAAALLAALAPSVNRHDALLTHLAEAAQHHSERLDRLDALLAGHQARLDRLDTLLAQQVEINADVKTTLARIETLLDRLPRQGENGRDA